MLKIQKSYLEYLKDVESKLNTIEISDEVKEIFSIVNLEESIRKQELIIPIVGAFSAGKSSLINSFLGDEILPVGITPETSLATELRYEISGNERIEAVKADSTFDTFKVEEINNIGEYASKYKFLRLYLSNDKLAGIKPLIIVDMPGFESPLDLHYKAITEYLDKGVHYIVLTNIEDGTITRSMIRQLEIIKEYKRDFSFFLSKSNLRPKGDVDDVIVSLQEIISDTLDLDKTIIPIDDNGGESLKKILNQINPEELFKSLFVDSLKDLYYSISDAMNTTISALGESKEDNKKSLDELARSIESINQKREELIGNAKEEYSNINITRIIDNVGREITNSIEELITIAISGGEEALFSAISEIVRSALISNIKITMSDIGDEIVDAFSLDLSELHGLDTSSVLSSDFIENIAGGTKEMLQRAIKGLGNIANINRNKGLYKSITSILAITTSIVAPLIEVVIVFLPEILDMLFSSIQKQKQKEKIKEAIFTIIIPSIKRKLRETLPGIFNTQLDVLINNISDNLEEEINKKKVVISSTEDEIKAKIENVDATISNYKAIIKDITTLSNTVIFK